MRVSLLTVAVALASAVQPIATAAVPAQITVQGKVTDTLDNPLPPGPQTFTFRIFDAFSGGTQVWPAGGVGDVQIISTYGLGLWVGSLGDNTPLTDAVFADTLRWLEINIDGTTLARTLLMSAPTAFRVATVDGATGGSITSKVSIGPGHTNTGADGFVAGNANQLAGDYSVIDGGRSNTASGTHSVIGGGASNVASGDSATIAGGTGNEAPAMLSTVGGGARNRATVLNTTVAGGSENAAAGLSATIGGGYQNYAASTDATVAGGYADSVTGSGATIGGGSLNRANGAFAVVPGGYGNAARGASSLAVGLFARANHDGSFVWSDRSPVDPSADTMYSTASNQFLIRAVGGVGIGTNAPGKALQIGDNSRLGSQGMIRLESRSVNGSPEYREWEIGVPQTGAVSSGKGYDFVIDDANLGSDPEAVFQWGSGYLGMGVLDPVFRIDLPNVGNASGQGRANAWTIYSSKRWKKNISPIQNPLEKVIRLNGVEYDNISDDSHSIGLIAEEVGQVVPEVVQYESNGTDAASLDYARLTALLIEAVKEQQEQINDQRKEIQELRRAIVP